jgi:hypothetical protein
MKSKTGKNTANDKNVAALTASAYTNINPIMSHFALNKTPSQLIKSAYK